ncbi:quinon protein alcohol dehydrogenase-like superfamily [Russula earlei]|uniref:Quinon protein alcohol dehydrogenase-like superfamily n=1 Tax=Russula earlei TaxID=71964 RepID=A0ACC0U925_9AGAM|nr:quinon protein alcohol dehydrogenase-like superfamily [Russula earlei]
MSFLDPYFVPTPLLNFSCLDSTRSYQLSEIIAWFDKTDEPNVLWISGAPGSGKTSIAWSLIAELEKQQRSAGEFFFRPGQHTPQQLWRTMAFKMAEFHPALKSEINKVLKREEGFDRDNITLTFEKLVAGPLKALDVLLSNCGPILLIDDLEQCSRWSPDWETVLDTLPLWLSLPPHCKLIITSRHQHDIAKVFENKDIKRVELLTGNEADYNTDSDVRTYLNHCFTEMKRQDNSIPKDWPRDDAISKLVEHAKGFFKWAALVVDDIQKPGRDRDKQLATIVEGGTTIAVDDLDPYLEQIFQTEFESNPSDPLLATMATIALSKRPLTLDDLKHFLENQNQLPSSTEPSLDDICRHLLPIVSIDSESVHNNAFLIDRSKVHREMAISCLKIMQQKLKFNICGLKSSYQMNYQVENKIEEHIPSHLAYSCQFWADHLRDIGATEKRDTELVSLLKNFLNFQLLYWLEVLSLLSQSNLASKSLLVAAEWLEATDKDLSLLAADASRFSVTFADVISESAPHIYLSALPFAPPSSPVSKRYRDPFSRTIKVLHEEGIKWPSMRFSIPTNGSVNSVSIHPEGKRVAAAMSSGDAMVFSMTLGETLFPLSGHGWSTIRSIAYSPKGKRIATGCDDRCLRIFNAENGSLLFGPFELHSDWIRSIAWSPDGQRIVTCSDDRKVKIVAVETGEVIHDTALHSDWVRTVLYTTDFFISGSDDRTVRIYDATTGEASGEAWSMGQGGFIKTIAISPDKKILAAGGDDRSIVLYNMDTRTMMNQPMRGHTQSVISLAFSPDGQWLASGSEDCTVRLWNVQTGQKLCDPLYGHSSNVNCVRFSPGMKQLVTGDEGRSIRFFDLDALPIQRNAQESTGTLPIQVNAQGGTGTLPIQPNAQGGTGTLPIQPNAQRGTGVFLATIACHDGHTILASDGSIISRWNVNNGNVEKAPLEGDSEHLANVQSVSISPNGQLIVTAARRTMMIWEVESGAKLCGPLEGHEDVINALNFSADSKKVVSGSDDRSIRIWSAKTGQSIGGPMKGHDDSVRCVCFSPDGKQVASGSYDTIIWSVESGEKVHEPLSHHGGSINAVSYSPNGLYLATASNDYTVAICDVATGGQNVLRRLSDHGGGVKVLSWSPDSEKIISGASDNIIRVFEVETSILLCEPLTGHTNEVTAISFRSLRHSKEQQIVSCSLDGTVRVWELRIRSFAQTQRFSEDHNDWVHAIAFSPLDDSIASGDDDGQLVVMDAVAGTHKFSKNAHKDWIRCVTYSPDGKRIATCSLDGMICIWDAESGDRLLEPIRGHTEAVLSIEFSPDGKFLVSGSEDKTVRTWDTLPVLDNVFDLNPPAYHGHTGAVNAVAYADGGKLIVSGSATAEIAVLDVLNGTVGETSKRQFSALGGAILSICVFGKKIFSSSEDKTIRVWELHTGHALFSILLGHTGPVNAITLTPDGKRIISASDDGSLRIFHSDNGEACVMPFYTSNRIFSVAVSHRGTLVASGGEDMNVHVWRANMEGRAVWPDDFIRKVRTLEFCLVDERGVLADFTMQSDGWLHGCTGDPICWIPPFYRTGLWTPRTVGIIGASETILDLRSLVHGTNWEQCRTHDFADKA